MDRIALDLDRMALALGRALIENMVLQQQLEAVQQEVPSRQAGAPEPSYPLEMDHDRVEASSGR